MIISVMAAIFCVAQDGQYSYEGNSARTALRACQATSENPRACYLHRCTKRAAERSPPRLSPEEARSINDAILQQRCIAGGDCAGAELEILRRRSGRAGR